MMRIKRLLLGLVVAAIGSSLASVPFAEPAIKRQKKKKTSREKPSTQREPRVPTTTDEKLQALTRLEMTSAEIAVATGCSVRAIEERRRKLNEINRSQRSGRRARVDDGIDAFYSLIAMLENRFTIPPHNIRAWFIGRSPYLDEQRPAQLLGAGEFELVREAAIAYATNEAPSEFCDRVGTIARVPDALEA